MEISNSDVFYQFGSSFVVHEVDISLSTSHVDKMKFNKHVKSDFYLDLAIAIIGSYSTKF